MGFLWYSLCKHSPNLNKHAPPMKTLILPNHIVTLTSNGNLEIDKTQHNTGKFKEREDTIVLRFSKDEVEKIREFLMEQ
jgi:hypothetical protein